MQWDNDPSLCSINYALWCRFEMHLWSFLDSSLVFIFSPFQIICSFSWTPSSDINSSDFPATANSKAVLFPSAKSHRIRIFKDFERLLRYDISNISQACFSKAQKSTQNAEFGKKKILFKPWLFVKRRFFFETITCDAIFLRFF